MVKATPTPRKPASWSAEPQDRHDFEARAHSAGVLQPTEPGGQIALLDQAITASDEFLQDLIIDHARKKALEELAQEKAEREAREKAEREAKEKAEREAKEKAEREAREKAEREAKEKAEREAREKAEREAREKAERVGAEATTSPSRRLEKLKIKPRVPLGRSHDQTPTKAEAEEEREGNPAQSSSPRRRVRIEKVRAACPLTPKNSRSFKVLGHFGPGLDKGTSDRPASVPGQENPAHLQRSPSPHPAKSPLPDDEMEPIRLTDPIDGRDRTILPKPKPERQSAVGAPKPIRLQLKNAAEDPDKESDVPILSHPPLRRRGLASQVSKAMSDSEVQRKLLSESDPFDSLLDKDLDVEWEKATPSADNAAS